MASAAFEQIAEDLEFLPDWEERYAHVIQLGKAMPPLDEAEMTPEARVHGCASQVWLVLSTEGGRLHFKGWSDAMIVKGLVSIVIALYDGLTPAEALQVNAAAELGRLGFDQHLSAQRTNGLRAMVQRIRQIAEAAQ